MAVALRKESVDRNVQMLSCMIGPPWSLSARRAWIEMVAYLATSAKLPVALRKESVDRNCDVSLNYKEVLWSLSARRAWIEILLRPRY